MYKVFALPENFLNHKYSETEKNKYDQAIDGHICGSLNEELTDTQKRRVREYSTSNSVRKSHDEVFGEGNERIVIPLERSTKPTTHNDLQNMSSGWGVNPHHTHVLNHLAQNGYHVTDYNNGVAKKSDGSDDREVSIGKILSRTGGDQKMTTIMSKPKYAINPENGTHLKDADGNKIVTRESKPQSVSQVFASDPIRASQGGLNVHITRNKFDVCGMSTNRSWKSCMNLDGGGNRHYLKNDIEHGTLTAYLTHKDDSNIDHPIGRINLKRFEPIGDSGKAIYRPEDSKYGTLPHEFRKQVSDWAEKNYPSDEKTFAYSKASGLYNDDGKSLITNPKASVQGMDHAKLHDVINSHIKHEIDAHEGAPVNSRDHFGFNPHEHAGMAELIVSRMLHTPEQRSNHAYHAIAETNHDLDGNTDHENPFGKDNEWDWDRNSTNADNMHLHAVHGFNKAGLLKDDEVAHHLSNYNSKFGKDEDHADDDKYSSAKDAHSELIHEAFKRPSLANHPVIEETIHHIYDHPDYHKSIDYLHGHSIPEDIVQRTKNPRLMEKMFSHEHDSYSPHPDIHTEENYRHAGRHADLKLADQLSTHHDEYLRKNLVRGLNSNPEGEKIQHKLTDGLYLHGGSNAEQTKNFNVYHINRDSMSPKAKSSLQDYANSQFMVSEPAHDDETHNQMFNSIAEHSKFPSVLKKIASRHDIPTEVQNHAKENLGIKTESFAPKKTKNLFEFRNYLNKSKNPLY